MTKLEALQAAHNHVSAWLLVRAPHHVASDIANLLDCVSRVLKGQLNDEEFQNLCHNLSPEDECAFKNGCVEFQKRLFGHLEGREA